MKICKFYYYTRNYDFAKGYVDDLNQRLPDNGIRHFWLEPSGYDQEVYGIVWQYRVFGKVDAYIIAKITRFFMKIAEKLYSM